MHGFLNLLAATIAARAGAPVDELAQILSCEDEGAFKLAHARFEYPGGAANEAELRAARTQGFVAYGSCSFAEPIDDLQRMNAI